MLDVVGVGTNSVDEVLLLPGDIASLLATGKARVTERRFLCGGQTATVMAACAAMGLRAGYVGAFGSDEHGRRIRSALTECGVDVERSVQRDAPNRGAVILVDARGTRTVLWHRASELTAPVRELRTSTLHGRLVHVDDDDPDLALRAATIARSAGTPVTSDLEHVSDSVEQLIAQVTVPIFEQHLPERITGDPDPEGSLRKLRRLNDGVLVMTRGEAGAVALDGDVFHAAPAFKVKVIDATGAGDVFRAGYIYGLLQSWPVPKTLRFANAAAALACTKLGAMPSVPPLAEVENLLAHAH